MERWNKSKTEELQKKSKTKQEMAKLKELEEEEKRQKMIATQAVSEKWREEKTRDLVKKQRKLRKKREEEAKKNIEKMTEKTDDAVHAFNAWYAIAIRVPDLLVHIPWIVRLKCMYVCTHVYYYSYSIHFV